MREHGPWKISSTREAYRDPWVHVVRDEVVRPDGTPGTYATVHLKHGVTVLAIDENEQLHLTREFHYAVGRVTVEAVSGGMEAGETALETGQRELAEELGISAAKWTHLSKVDPFTAAVFSTVDIFVAEQLEFHDKNPEGTELIEHVTFPLAQGVEEVMQGRITHGPTCIAILWLALIRSRP